MRHLAACVAVTLLASLDCAHAQTPQPGELQPSRPGEGLRPLPELQELPPAPEFKLPPVAPPPREAPLSRGPRFLLRGVEFEGNTVFSDDALSEVAASFVGRIVAAEDLEELRRNLTLLYVEAGYINSGAVLPDQRVVEGRITYRIVEGKLSDIVVTGNDRISSGYVTRRIERDAGPPLNVKDLERRLRILLDDPLIDRVDAELRPGVEPGEGELQVRVRDAPPFQFNLSIDNGRSPSVGAVEGRGQMVFRNWSGLGEIGSISIGKTEGLREISGDLSVPITPWDTRLGFRGEDTETEVVEEPFNEIDVEGESQEYEVNLRQPLYQAPGQELAVSLAYEWRESETFLLGQRFSFAEGVDNGRSVVSVFRGSVDWLDRSPEHVIALRSTFSLGTDTLGATNNASSAPDGEFFHWIGQAQWVQRFEIGKLDNLRAVLRGEAQLTDDRLLPLEKFSNGGADTVRGYRENLLVRDNGWNASLEFRVPVLNLSVPGLEADLQDGRVDLAPFFDIGQSWNNGVNDPSPKTISSVGLGLRWAPIRGVLASLYWGYALTDVDDPPDKDLQDYGIHFSVRASIF